MVRLDGNQQGGVYDEAKYLNFNADESHFVFIAKLGSSWVLVLDAQQRPPEYTTISSITFQPGEAFYAFCACKAKKCRLVVDGAETDASYEEISYPQYSRDGKRLAFVGKRDKKWIAIVDGKETGPQLDDFSHGIVVRLRQLAGRGARGMASRQIAAETTPFFPLYVAPGMKCEDCAWVSSFHVGRLVSQSSAQPSLFRGWHTDIAEKRPTRIVRRTVKL